MNSVCVTDTWIALCSNCYLCWIRSIFKPTPSVAPNYVCVYFYNGLWTIRGIFIIILISVTLSAMNWKWERQVLTDHTFFFHCPAELHYESNPSVGLGYLMFIWLQRCRTVVPEIPRYITFINIPLASYSYFVYFVVPHEVHPCIFVKRLWYIR
jgi:hypothetical protein